MVTMPRLQKQNTREKQKRYGAKELPTVLSEM